MPRYICVNIEVCIDRLSSIWGGLSSVVLAIVFGFETIAGSGSMFHHDFDDFDLLGADDEVDGLCSGVTSILRAPFDTDDGEKGKSSINIDATECNGKGAVSVECARDLPTAPFESM